MRVNDRGVNTPPLLFRRSSLGTSRHARLVQLPIAVAAVRHGVQTVLCNCYPFLDTKGGREGKKLLASLHEVNTTLSTPEKIQKK